MVRSGVKMDVKQAKFGVDHECHQEIKDSERTRNDMHVLNEVLYAPL